MCCEKLPRTSIPAFEPSPAQNQVTNPVLPWTPPGMGTPIVPSSVQPPFCVPQCWSRTWSTEILEKSTLGTRGMFGIARKGSKNKNSPWISELSRVGSWKQQGARAWSWQKNPPERGEFHPGRAFPALSRSRSPWNWEVLLQAVPVSLVGSGLSFSSTSLDFRSPLWAGILKKWTRSDAVFWG